MTIKNDPNARHTLQMLGVDLPDDVEIASQDSDPEIHDIAQTIAAAISETLGALLLSPKVSDPGVALQILTAALSAATARALHIGFTGDDAAIERIAQKQGELLTMGIIANLHGMRLQDAGDEARRDGKMQ